MAKLIEKKEYFCLECKEKLVFQKKFDSYQCYNCYGLSYSKIILDEVNPNIEIYLGKIKGKGNYYLVINSDSGKLAFCCYNKWSGSYKWNGPYEFEDISISVSTTKETIYKTSGATPMIVGGILFGSAGAIAGSIVGSKEKSSKVKDHYTIQVTTNDLKFSGFVISTDDANLAHDVITRVEIIRKKIEKQESGDSLIEDVAEKQRQTDVKNDISIYEKLIELKNLYDSGIIDLETYEEKKKKYIDLL